MKDPTITKPWLPSCSQGFFFLAIAEYISSCYHINVKALKLLTQLSQGKKSHRREIRTLRNKPVIASSHS